ASFTTEDTEEIQRGFCILTKILRPLCIYLCVLRGFVFAALLLLACTVAAADLIRIPFETSTLPNGLTVVLAPDHSTPTVAVDVWYHVGSKNEVRGRTGFAHLFEH